MDFVVPGPGARDGIRKCFVDPGGLNEPELIRLMADLQEQEFERLSLNFQSLWGRQLQLIREAGQPISARHRAVHVAPAT